MKVVAIHAERFRYDNVNTENALVAFVAVEPGDEDVVEDAADDLVRHASKLGAKVIVIYPYSKLGAYLAKPWKAEEILKRLYEELKRRGVQAYLGPFKGGKFVLEVYAHPLAHAFKSYHPKGKRFSVVKEYVVSPSGEFKDPEECYDPELSKVISFMRGELEYDFENDEAVKYCKRFGLVQNPSSPPGHCAYLPLGYFMFLAFTVHASSVAQALEIPVMSIKTPEVVSYGTSVSCVSGFLRDDEFNEHLKIIEEFAELDELPIALFEVANLYREEKEVIPCYRAKSFVVPRVRIFSRDPFETANLALTLHELIHNEAEKLGLRYVAAYTVSEGFLDEVRDLIVKLVKRDNRCAYVRVVNYPGKFLDAEMHIINSKGVPIELGTWKMRKIKVKNEEVFSISSAIMGSFERYMYVIFDKAIKDMKEGKTPELPAWLSPIQVRIIPKSRDNLAYALGVAEELKSRGIRVDIDDRSVPFSKKLRDAGKEWIPFIAVIGEREEKLGRVVLIRRRTNDREDVDLDELVKRVMEEVGSYPQLPQTLPMLYSKRPKFARPDEELGQ